MTTLLAAQAVLILVHASVDVLIAHVGLLVREASVVKCFEQAKVAHDGGNYGLLSQATILVKVGAADVEDQVSINHVAALVNCQAAVSVTIVGKAHVKAILNYKTLQLINVGRTAINIDVEAVWSVVDNMGLSTQSVKNRASNTRSCAVCAIQANLQALEAKTAASNKAGDVAVAALHVINRAANAVTRCQRNVKLAVNIGLYLLKDVLVHLVAVFVDQLDAVIGKWVVRSGNHDATVKGTVYNLVADARCRNDVQHVCVGTRSNQARDKRGLKHIA